MKWFARITFFFTLILLSGCADPVRDYPALSPTDQLLAEPKLRPGEAYPKILRDQQSSRADALRDRAADLRGPVIDPEIRRRMTQVNG